MTIPLLETTLSFAVPMHILQLRVMTQEQREDTIAQWAAEGLLDLLASSDALFRYDPPHTAQAFNALARTLASLAFRPGGVDFGGHHWEATVE